MVATFGSKGKGMGEFDGPYMMSFRKQGGLPSRLLVADYGNNRVQEVGFCDIVAPVGHDDFCR
jgi:hypothetical protein